MSIIYYNDMFIVQATGGRHWQLIYTNSKWATTVFCDKNKQSYI